MNECGLGISNVPWRSVEIQWNLAEGKGDPEMNLGRRQEVLLPVGSRVQKEIKASQFWLSYFLSEKAQTSDRREVNIM